MWLPLVLFELSPRSCWEKLARISWTPADRGLLHKGRVGCHSPQNQIFGILGSFRVPRSYVDTFDLTERQLQKPMPRRTGGLVSLICHCFHSDWNRP